MHELLLFASVPHHQHHELRQQLAGLTAMQPRHRLERRLIFKAYRKPGVITTRVGASQDVPGVDLQRLNKMLNGGMFYTQVVGPVLHENFAATGVTRGEGGDDPDAAMSGIDESQKDSFSNSSYDYESQSWKLEFRDIPEAGTRSAVTARLMASAGLPKGDIIEPMNAWGYGLVLVIVLCTLHMIVANTFQFRHRIRCGRRCVHS